MSLEIENKREFKCAVCERTFSPKYRLSRHRVLTACSKSCAAKVKDGEFHRKSDIDKRIISLIKNEARYLTKQEIIDALQISTKTLTAYSVSTFECNKTAGFKKPARIFENLIFEILETRFKVESEVKFQDCVSPKGVLLRFDFFLRDEKILVEADGSQHKEGHPWHRTYHSECDSIKDTWAREHGIRLVRIPYTKRITEQFVFHLLETEVATTQPATANVNA